VYVSLVGDLHQEPSLKWCKCQWDPGWLQLWLSGMHCTHPGFRGVAGIMSVTMPLSDWKTLQLLYFWPVQSLLKMTCHYTNTVRIQSC